MNPIFKFEGIYTPVVTPFNADRSINFAALADVVENLIDKGVNGLISGGSTGENYAQTGAERIEIARFTGAQAKGRVPLIVGTGAMMTADSKALATAAKEMKADALLVATPPYSVPTERENALNALAIDKVADLPIMLYNYPGRMGVHMGEEFLDRVGRSRNFCAIKESSGDINRVHLLARDYPHIQMSCAEWMIKRLSFLPGGLAVGFAVVPISCPKNMLRCTKPALLKGISTKVAVSCRR